MPTLIFLALAYQIENKKWRYFFLILGGVNLIFNIFYGTWVQEIYAAAIALLLYTLNPFFISWWDKRNSRNNPSSFLQFLNETYQVAKFNKVKIFYYVLALACSITAVVFYIKYTGYTLLGWLLGLYLVIYILKKLFYSMMAPEWFLHDINTGYVFLTVFIAWGISEIMNEKLGVHFILPMLFSTLFCLGGIYLMRNPARFLVPGCAILLADMTWQVVRYVQNNRALSGEYFITELVLIAAMIIGLIWLIKKPGVMPIVYLALFQLFRFAAFTYQAIDRSAYDSLTTPEVTYYILYLVCWMYIMPLMFWFIGAMQQKPKESIALET